MLDHVDASAKPANPLGAWVAGALVFIALVIAYQPLVEHQVLGFIHDDAVYAISAKALVYGKGYLLEHIVTQPHQLKYPLIFPTLLAGIWLLFPKFPANLTAMTQVPLILGALGMGVLVPYLVRVERFSLWLSLLLVFICSLNFYWMYHTTAIMAEGPYLLFSVLTLWAAHRWTHPSPHNTSALTAKTIKNILSQRGFWLTLLLTALSFHTRSIGITLVVAIAGYQVLHRRWREGLVFLTLGVLITLVPWSIRNACHAHDFAHLDAHPFLQAYANYGAELARNATGNNYLGTVTQALGELIGRLLELMFPIFKYGFELLQLQPKQIPIWLFLSQFVVVTGLAYGLLLFFLWQAWQGVRYRRWSLPGIYLAIYLTLICVWNYDNQVARFLAVVLPFLWLVLLHRVLRFNRPVCAFNPNLAARLPWLQKLTAGGGLAVIMMTLAIPPAITGYRSLAVIRRDHILDSGGYRNYWAEYKDVLQFIRHHLSMTTPIAAEWDTVFYLYTGRPTYYLYYPSVLRRHGQILPKTWPTLLTTMQHYGGLATWPLSPRCTTTVLPIRPTPWRWNSLSGTRNVLIWSM
jgi:hypothetical protein